MTIVYFTLGSMYSLCQICLIHSHKVVHSESTRSDGARDDFSIESHTDIQVLPYVSISLFQGPASGHVKVSRCTELR